MQREPLADLDQLQPLTPPVARSHRQEMSREGSGRALADARGICCDELKWTVEAGSQQRSAMRPGAGPHAKERSAARLAWLVGGCRARRRGRPWRCQQCGMQQRSRPTPGDALRDRHAADRQLHLVCALARRPPARVRRDDGGRSEVVGASARCTRPREPLAGTEGASFPFWAPDADAIGFFAEGKLKRVDIAGGAPQALADAPNGRGGTWNPEGVICSRRATLCQSPKRDHAGIRRGRHANRGDASRTWRRQPPVAAVSPRRTPVHVLQHGRSPRHPGRVPRIA